MKRVYSASVVLSMVILAACTVGGQDTTSAEKSAKAKPVSVSDPSVLTRPMARSILEKSLEGPRQYGAGGVWSSGHIICMSRGANQVVAAPITVTGIGPGNTPSGRVVTFIFRIDKTSKTGKGAADIILFDDGWRVTAAVVTMIPSENDC